MNGVIAAAPPEVNVIRGATAPPAPPPLDAAQESRRNAQDIIALLAAFRIQGDELVRLDDHPEDKDEPGTTLAPAGPIPSPTATPSLYAEDTPHAPLEGEQCVICTDAFDRGDVVAVLPCSHIFHSACIADWLVRKATCPVCRLKLTVPMLRGEGSREYDNGATEGAERPMRAPATPAPPTLLRVPSRGISRVPSLVSRGSRSNLGALGPTYMGSQRASASAGRGPSRATTSSLEGSHRPPPGAGRGWPPTARGPAMREGGGSVRVHVPAAVVVNVPPTPHSGPQASSAPPPAPESWSILQSLSRAVDSLRGTATRTGPDARAAHVTRTTISAEPLNQSREVGSGRASLESIAVTDRDTAASLLTQSPSGSVRSAHDEFRSWHRGGNDLLGA